ncbi:hypothetical protein D3C80_1096310 [compost metagenome]
MQGDLLHKFNVRRFVARGISMDKKPLILGQELGQTVCQVLGLDASKITSITIRMEANTAACVEVVRTINRTEGEQIAGALEVYGLTRRGM